MRRRILQGKYSPSTAECTCELAGFRAFDYRLPATDYRRPTGGDMAVSDKVKSIIVEQLGVDDEEVTPDASFVDDLGADSLDTVELVMAFEEEFGIEIPDEDAEKITRVKEAIEYIEAHAKKKQWSAREQTGCRHLCRITVAGRDRYAGELGRPGGRSQRCGDHYALRSDRLCRAHRGRGEGL